MKPSKMLVDALRRAADRIETVPVYENRQHTVGLDDFYAHSQSDSCNCGWLARCLSIKRRDLFGQSYYSESAFNFFNGKELKTCSVAKRPFAEVFAALVAAGLEKEDFGDIEWLRSAPVLVRAGIIKEDQHYSVPNNVARYFRAQADMLEEQLTPKPAPVVQPCVHMWLECGVCMICSASKPVENQRKEVA